MYWNKNYSNQGSRKIHWHSLLLNKTWASVGKWWNRWILPTEWEDQCFYVIFTLWMGKIYISLCNSCSWSSTPFCPLLQFTQEWQVNFWESNTNHCPHNCNHTLQLYVILFTYAVSLWIVISGKWIERAKLHPAQAEFVGSVVVKPTDISTNLRKNKIFGFCKCLWLWMRPKNERLQKFAKKNNFWKEIPVFNYFIRMLHNDTNFSATEVVLSPRALSSLWKTWLYFQILLTVFPNISTNSQSQLANPEIYEGALITEYIIQRDQFWMARIKSAWSLQCYFCFPSAAKTDI